MASLSLARTLAAALAALALSAHPAAAAAPDPEAAQTAAPAARPEPSAASTVASPPLASLSPMVEITGGRFVLGAPVGPLDEYSAIVRVKDFLLDRTEVTVAAYAECVKARRCTPASATIEWEGVSRADTKKWSSLCNRDRADRADHPVNCVDWWQARDYCAFAGKRLPTSEEWEWAARNGEEGTIYPWGDDPPGDRPCWSGEKGEKADLRDGTCPVGSHPASDTRSGVKDLAGNVWEWTATETVILADSRGRNGAPARIARGGGWSDRVPRYLMTAPRAKDREKWRAADLGFRCAKDP